MSRLRDTPYVALHIDDKPSSSIYVINPKDGTGTTMTYDDLEAYPVLIERFIQH